ncbi:MAG: hypothetical protein JNL02_09200 [Saprospiraceae bacterium]|nr:hypothetical protein [Saprospiraceae bacterium]
MKAAFVDFFQCNIQIDKTEVAPPTQILASSNPHLKKQIVLIKKECPKFVPVLCQRFFNHSKLSYFGRDLQIIQTGEICRPVEG